MAKKNETNDNGTAADLDFETELWKAADALRFNMDAAEYKHVVLLKSIRQHSHILTPGHYVSAAEAEDDGEPFDDKMKRLTDELREQSKQAAKLDKLIWANLEAIGYGG